jgi:hypothetical protein
LSAFSAQIEALVHRELVPSGLTLIKAQNTCMGVNSYTYHFRKNTMAATGDAEVPPQWKPQEIYDFRHGADGPRGYKVGVTKYGNIGSKRKLDEYSEQVRTSRNQ